MKPYVAVLSIAVAVTFALWVIYELTALSAVPYSKIYEAREATQSSRSAR